MVVWQKAMDLVDSVYDLAESFPAKEGYGLTSQITRAAVSVPANITVAVRRGYVSEPEAGSAYSLITEISKMLTSLRRQIAAKGRRA